MSSRKRTRPPSRRPLLQFLPLEDRVTPTISVNSPAAVNEGNAGTTTIDFTVSLTAANPGPTPIFVFYSTADGNAANPEANATTADGDYVGVPNTLLTFNTGEQTKTVSVTVNGDTKYEANESFRLVLSNAVNDTIAAGTGIGTITNDETAPTVSLDAPSVAAIAEAGGTATVNATLSFASGVATVVNLSFAGSATLGTDYTASATSITIPAGATTATTPLTLTATQDTTDEVNETIDVSIAGVANNYATPGGTPQTVAITDDDPSPTANNQSVTTDQGIPKAITLTATENSTPALPLTYTVTVNPAHGTLSGTAPNLTYTPNAGYSGSDSFQFKANNGATDSNTATVSITVTQAPTVSIGSPTVTEGDTGTVTATFQVLLSNASGQTVSMNYATANGSAAAGTDYAAASGTLTFAPGQTSKTISVTVNGDNVFEGNETFVVNLTGLTYGTFTNSQGTATVTDDDAAASISVAGGINQIAVTNGPFGGPLVALVKNAAGTPVQGVTVTFTPPAAGASVSFANPAPDTDPMGRASTGLATANGTVGAYTVTAQAAGGSSPSTTFNLTNQPPVALSINDLSMAEGNAGTTTYTFTVTASQANPVATMTVDYATADGTATTADGDYVAVGSTTLTFAPNETTKTVTVTVNGDAKFENNETFFVNLSGAVNASISDNQGQGTITNDDTAPTLAIDDVTAAEGNSGTTAYTFTVTQSAVSGLTTTVNYTTADGTATAGSDYTAKSGTLTFAPGVTSQTVTVLVNGDTVYETDQTFFLNLSAATNATIADSQGLGTVTNDDAAPTLAINDVSASESNGTITFTVTRSGATEVAISVNYATADGTAVATAGGPGTPDFTAASGALNFTPSLAATATQTFTVALTDDNVYEAAEQFVANLSAPTGATLADGQGVATITNDDAAPSLAVNDITVSESGAATFTVTLTGATALPVMVNFATANGTAVLTAGGPGTPDYTPTAGTLTFGPSASVSQTQTITVLLTDDATNEPTEQFSVNLYSPTNGATLADDQGIATINDDDPVPSIAITDVTLAEGNSGTTSFNFTVSLSAASAQTITVNYATANGMATAGSDYTAASGTLTFTPGQTSKTVTVLVTGDVTFETDETFFVNLTGATNATIADTQGVGTIQNDEAAPVLTINDVTVNEDAGTATFTVTRTGASELTSTVAYATADGTGVLAAVATAGGPGTPDYTATSGTLTFAPSLAATATQTFTVAITDDGTPNGTDEANEQFVVNLSAATAATISDNQGIATITDDDDAPTISIADVTHPEGDSGTTAYAFTVTLSAASGQTVTLNYATADGTANAGSDYTATSGTLTFAPGETTKTVTVNANGDTLFEANQFFRLNLSAAVNVGLPDPQAVGFIDNDDAAPTLALSLVTAVGEAAGPITFTVTRTGATEVESRVDYATADGTAVSIPAGPGTPDYMPTGTQTLIIPASLAATATGMFNVTLVNDNVYETSVEQFLVTLTNPVNANLAMGQSTAAGLIMDNDPAPILSVAAGTVGEGGGPAVFTVTLSNPTALPISFDYTTADGTAVAVGTAAPGTPDYVAKSGTLTFNPSTATTQTLTILVPLVNDTTNEASEQFSVMLSNPTNGATIATGPGSGTAAVTVTDNDAVPSLSIGDVTQAEGTGGSTTFSFTVTLSAASAQTVTVNYATATGTAGAADFTAATGTLTFAPGETTKTVTVNVTGDNIYENDETFVVNLSGPTNATLADGQGVGTVTNDDAAPTFAISDPAAVDESAGTVTFTVTLTGPTEVAATVAYATADDTAVSTAGGPGTPDYTSKSGTLTFNPGITSRTFSVSLTNDNVYEAVEQFVANLTAPTGATVADAQGVATITDADAAPTLAVNDITVSESGTATFTVTLTGATALPIAVDYATADGTAVSTATADPGTPDYTPTAGTLTFSPSASGTQTLTFTVPLTNDLVLESTEQFAVNLSNATNAATITDALGVATVTNDDGPPAISVSDVTLAEGDAGTTAFTFVVSLSAASATTVTVSYATADGTALAGSDYTAASGLLTFTPGNTTQAVTVLVTGDVVFEVGQTFTVNLSAPTSATIADGVGVGTIANDDAAPTFSVSDATVTEGGLATFTVTRTGATELSSSVAYATADGTGVATAGGAGTPDYTAASGVLTFAPSPAATETQTFTVATADDDVYEGDEQFGVSLSAPTDATVADGQGVATITDNETAPTLSIGDVTVSEGGTAAFTVTLTGTTAVAITVNYATADGTAVSVAAGPGTPDYTPAGGTLTFFPSTAGTQTRVVTVLVTNDTTPEQDETFAVNLSAPSSGATLARGQGVASVFDDDGVVALSVDSPTVTEGNAGTTSLTFTVSLSSAIGVPVSVSYATADGTATVADGDYQPVGGTLTFAPGETTKTVTVAVNGDAGFEPNETVLLALSSPVNAGIATGTGTGTVLNDDTAPTPTLSVTPGTVAENGGVATVTATLPGPSPTPVTVKLFALPRVSFPGDPTDDVTVSSYTVTIPAGSLSGSVTVTGKDDTVDEGTETFTLVAEGPDGSQNPESPTRVTITITDDDLPAATNDAATTAEDTSVSAPSVLANDAAAPGSTAQLVGGPANGTLSLTADGRFTYTPNKDFFGTDAFQYRVVNAAGETSLPATVAITVTPVNDPPTFAVGPNQTALRGSAELTVPNFVTGVSAGPGETGQAVTFSVTTDNPALFAVPPAVDAAGTLTYTPADGAFGTATVTVTASDDAGATAAPQTFTITVNKNAAGRPTSQNETTVFAVGAGDGGSGTVTVYNGDGSVAYTVTPFTDGDGSRAVVANTTGDATPDVIAGTGPGRPGTVVVIDGATKQPARTFTPFEASFTGGLFVAAGDVTGDGVADVAVTADTSGGPRVIVYDGVTGEKLADFFGIEDEAFRGGARLAVGDVNADGVADLVVVAGVGGGPRVAVFDGQTLRAGVKPEKLIPDFFAFEQSLRNGVYVTVGDLNGDGYDDLIFGGGPDGGPRVLAFDSKSLFSTGATVPAFTTLTSFFAGDPDLRTGVRVAAKDLDGDRKADLITAVPGGKVIVYLGADLGPAGGDETTDLSPFPGLADGVYVG